MPDRFAPVAVGESPIVGDYTLRKTDAGFAVHKAGDGAVFGNVIVRRIDPGLIVGQFVAQQGGRARYFLLRETPTGYQGRNLDASDWKTFVANNAAARELTAQGAVRIDGTLLVVRDQAALVAVARLSLIERSSDFTLSLRALTPAEIALQDRGRAMTSPNDTAGTRWPAPRASDPPRGSDPALRGDIDPLSRPVMPFVNGPPAFRPEAHMTICNDASDLIAAALVRSHGMFEAYSRQNFIAEGFVAIAPEQCHEIFFEPHLGSAGIVSIARRTRGGWVTPTYKEPARARRDADNAIFAPVTQYVCWPTSPQLATAIKPNDPCNDATRRVQFNLSYGTNGLISKLTLSITDDGFEQTWTERKRY